MKIKKLKITCERIGSGTSNIGGGSSNLWPDGSGKSEAKPSV